MRFLGRSLPAVALAGVLAACGGGGGGGGGGGPAPAQPCDSQTSRGDGFALGSCAATITNVFQPIEAEVLVGAGTDSYTLTLISPALPQLQGSTPFTSELRPPDELRNIIGVIQGQAYENPKQGAQAVPPYIALTDFFQARQCEKLKFNNQNIVGDCNTVLPIFDFARFGTWERFDGSGIDGFNEGYLGIWYSPVSAAVRFDIAAPPSEYQGRVVGLLGDGPGDVKAVGGRYGFSAPITIEVAGGRIQSAQLGALTISWLPTRESLRWAELALNAVEFQPSSNAPLLTGAVVSAAGSEHSIVSGDYEARFLGVTGNPNVEIAGRFRFTASNGVVVVASFAARIP